MTSMKVMNLRSQETMSGRKEFIVVGATAICGEDVYSKGKVGLIPSSRDSFPIPIAPFTV